MKSVPDKIQGINGKTQKEEKNKEGKNTLLLHLNCRIFKIQRENKKTQGSGINVRPMLQALLRFHISIIVKYCVIVFGKDIPEDAVNRKAKIAGKRKAAAMRADKIE